MLRTIVQTGGRTLNHIGKQDGNKATYIKASTLGNTLQHRSYRVSDWEAYAHAQQESVSDTPDSAAANIVNENRCFVDVNAAIIYDDKAPNKANQVHPDPPAVVGE